MKSFVDFVDTDYKDYFDYQNKYHVLLVTKQGRYQQIKYFRDACKKLGVNLFVVSDNTKLKCVGGVFVVKSNNKSVELNSSNTVALMRNYGVEETKDIRNLLFSSDIVCCNLRHLKSLVNNKYKCNKHLIENGVSAVDSVLITKDVYKSKKLGNANNLSKFVSDNKLKYPVVMKILSGSKGFGVFKCPDNSVLCSMLQYTIEKEENGVLVQPMLDIEYDLRVHVLCKTFNPERSTNDDYEIIGSMRRYKADNDFRTNFSVGGDIEKIDITDNQRKLAIDTMRAVKGTWCGIDICHDKSTDKDYVLEVNATPGLEGITSVSEENGEPSYMVVKCIKNFLDGKNESKGDDNMIASYHEKITLCGYGDIIASLDTGNSASSSLVVSEMEVDEKKNVVRFKYADKEFTKDIVGFISIRAAGDRKKMTRPVVYFDFVFMGKRYKNCEVNLNYRPSHKYKKKGILLSYKQIMEFGIKGINPNRNDKFNLTK